MPRQQTAAPSLAVLCKGLRAAETLAPVQHGHRILGHPRPVLFLSEPQFPLPQVARLYWNCLPLQRSTSRPVRGPSSAPMQSLLLIGECLETAFVCRCTRRWLRVLMLGCADVYKSRMCGQARVHTSRASAAGVRACVWRGGKVCVSGTTQGMQAPIYVIVGMFKYMCVLCVLHVCAYVQLQPLSSHLSCSNQHPHSQTQGIGQSQAVWSPGKAQALPKDGRTLSMEGRERRRPGGRGASPPTSSSQTVQGGQRPSVPQPQPLGALPT